ncbi:uncharacterized protein CMU_038150 [Cryptosporidium muris RN66]|uniref:Uncharacterized protein n=1 Tax=Cryptosporidium muris (strain RN66) TaxID=441375 RepID=B6A958_CRYMR|nr:uncharacterized protein CMU_038150 [Cryptosporidium muris RN66]EEA04749.1 hypothetical protein, conserved [Cryptosporidium muris RN66]|eukprot:XP_002139098.1 hypothetical protein [Cryptosporidium muris RN66]
MIYSTCQINIINQQILRILKFSIVLFLFYLLPKIYCSTIEKNENRQKQLIRRSITNTSGTFLRADNMASLSSSPQSSLISSTKTYKSSTQENIRKMTNITVVKSLSISRIVEACNYQKNLKGEARNRFFFLKCEYADEKKYILVPEVNPKTLLPILESTERKVIVPWKLNLEGARSALAYSYLLIKPSLQYSVVSECIVLPIEKVLLGNPKMPKLAPKLYDCSNGKKVFPKKFISILAKVDAYFQTRPERWYYELERAYRVSKYKYYYRPNSKSKEIELYLHPRYFVILNRSNEEIMNDILFVERLSAIPYLNIIMELKNSSFLHKLLLGKSFADQKVLVGRWYRRILRVIWLPFFTLALFMFQNGYKLHCDIHTRNMMIEIDSNFGQKNWTVTQTMNVLGTITPLSMKIIDIGNTITMNTVERQNINDPCKRYERRPYEDIGVIDLRVLERLTEPAKAPNYLPAENKIYSDDTPIEELESIRSIIHRYNKKLVTLRNEIRSISKWEACRIEKVDKKIRRLHKDKNTYPCRFVDQREALIRACIILKKYTSEQFLGVPSCALEPVIPNSNKITINISRNKNI